THSSSWWCQWYSLESRPGASSMRWNPNWVRPVASPSDLRRRSAFGFSGWRLATASIASMSAAFSSSRGWDMRVSGRWMEGRSAARASHARTQRGYQQQGQRDLDDRQRAFGRRAPGLGHAVAEVEQGKDADPEQGAARLAQGGERQQQRDQRDRQHQRHGHALRWQQPAVPDELQRGERGPGGEAEFLLDRQAGGAHAPAASLRAVSARRRPSARASSRSCSLIAFSPLAPATWLAP